MENKENREKRDRNNKDTRFGGPRDPGIATRFGGPRANPNGVQGWAVGMRDFYKWVAEVATADELREFMADESKPAIKRKFIQVFLDSTSVSDYFKMTDQFAGAPKQTVEVQGLPEIDCAVFGDTPQDEAKEDKH